MSIRFEAEILVPPTERFDGFGEKIRHEHNAQSTASYDDCFDELFFSLEVLSDDYR